MEDQLQFNVELVEKEIIKVELVEKELLKVNLNTLDLIPRKTYIWELEDIVVNNKQNLQVLVYDNNLGAWVNKYLSDILNLNETPTNVDPLPSKRFRTANTFLTGQLQAFLNGQKIHNSEITIHSNQEFSFSIDIVANDKIEVNYLVK